ncbi:hypothetical protein C8J57DRAFT_1221464 [Mycena rebaudengoi]|nr:hypothetical protein C8J57DRAFT_1221464 [Mycena rebaudengoi]
MEIIADLTEDVLAHQDIPCGRLDCNQVIQAGQRRYYIKSPNPTKSGKLVCKSCRDMYLQRAGTITRTKSRSQVPSETHVQAVRRNVIDTRNKGTIRLFAWLPLVTIIGDASLSERRVTPLLASSQPLYGHNYGAMLPPAAPSGSRHESFTSGAIVRVPNFNSRSTPHEFSSLLLHRYRRSRCANAAYASQSMNPNSTPPPWDAVPARLFPTGYSEAHRSYETTKDAWQQTAYKHTGIGPGLINEKVELFVQVLHEVPGKSQGKLVGNLSEGVKGVDANSTVYTLMGIVFFHMKSKLTAYMNGYPFDWSSLIIREVSTWIDLGNEPQESSYFYDQCYPVAGKGKGKGTRVFKKPTKTFVLAIVLNAELYDAAIEFSEAPKEIDQRPAKHQSTSKPAGIWVEPEENFRSSATRHSNEGDSTHRMQLRAAHWAAASVEENDERMEKRDCSNSPPVTPPPSKRRTVPAYESPDGLLMREALAAVISERIEYFPIQPPALKSLLEGSNPRRFTCDPELASQGSIVVNHSQTIGIGTFKTAHSGHLSLIHLPKRGLGQQPNSRVAVKCLYRARNKAADSTGPIKVSRLPFGDAAVAVSHEPLSGNNIVNISSIRRTYVLEEFIDTKTAGPYVKFVHDGSATPLLDEDDDLYRIAQFLCFTQHVQYQKTDQTVFISDLQGASSLLTDPQIMTAAEIADGVSIFGDGNVSSIFMKFPQQHICNEFCKWFQLPSYHILDS